MLYRLINFGEIGAKRIAGRLFWIGAVLSAILSIVFGRYLYLTNTYFREITFVQNGSLVFTDKEVNHLPLGIGGGIVLFAVSILLMRVACELLYLIVRCMETYLEKNSGNDDGNAAVVMEE